MLINSRQRQRECGNTGGSYSLAWPSLPGRERPRAAPPVDTVVLAPAHHGCDTWMLAGGFSPSTSPTLTRDPVLPQTYPVSAPYQEPGFYKAKNRTPSWPGAALGSLGALPTTKINRFFFPKPASQSSCSLPARSLACGEGWWGWLHDPVSVFNPTELNTCRWFRWYTWCRRGASADCCLLVQKWGRSDHPHARPPPPPQHDRFAC